MRTEAFDAMATGEWEIAPGVWQETELLWKPPTEWFSVNAFYTSAGMRNWYVNFEHPTTRTAGGFDTFDLTVDLVVARWDPAWPAPSLPQAPEGPAPAPASRRRRTDRGRRHL
ncbi:DUF402 domain-containing protein [Streptomyces europaeiscabiei]|uniref:DUF402 domain-containing protein n=1 Tax=Streptomyces europaeiscabiei TaxID=146819 RepID=UPI0029A80651|nr:DUF402 domain-containing protein [Streptomyces europaeiscabiei]MDX3696333.1 DUF402 domain-containing protein [Streptomyces europaeiscabiei]